MIDDDERTLLQRITTNPDVLCGKATIRGMRISAQQIVAALAAGVSENDLLHDYPGLEPDDIRAALLYAAKRIADEDVWPVRVA